MDGFDPVIGCYRISLGHWRVKVIVGGLCPLLPVLLHLLHSGSDVASIWDVACDRSECHRLVKLVMFYISIQLLSDVGAWSMEQENSQPHLYIATLVICWVLGKINADV